MTLDQAKELVAGQLPLLLVKFTFLDGSTLYLSTHAVTHGGQAYQARLSDLDLEKVQMMSESGIDIPPTLTLHIADADGSILTNYENATSKGFRGAKVEVRFVFYDVLAGTFSTDSLVRYTGICDPATPTDDAVLEVRTTNRLNASKKMLPAPLIQKNCPKIQPTTAAQCAAGLNEDSDFYPCGLTSPTDPCYNTRAGCLAIGNIRRHAGITYQPLTDGGRGREYTSGSYFQLYNSSNDAKYGEPWPVVLGRGWVECPVLNMRQDGNYTRCDVGLCWGHIDTGSGQTGSMKVVVNGYELPPGGYDDPTSGWTSLNPGNIAWWNWVSRGWRDGNTPTRFNGQEDPYGSETVIEVVLPRSQAGGESVPSVSVLFSGPNIRKYRAVASVSVSGGVGTITFTAINNDFASNSPFPFTLSGNSFSAANGSYSHLTNWTYGPPGTVTFEASGVPNGSGTGGSVQYEDSTDNPAWHLLWVLKQAGWTSGELDITSFTTAAEICDAPITYTSQYGGTASHARYKSNVILRQRRQASDIIRGIRQNCCALLQPNRDTGKLSVIVKGTLADQQPSAVAGSNYNTAVVSITRGGTITNGFVAYRFSEDNTISIKGISRPISDTPNRIAFQFQDSENSFAQTSIALSDSDDVERVGQEVGATVSIDGCATYDQSVRLAKIIQKETHRGNAQGDTRGTRWFELVTSIRAIRVYVGQIVMVDWAKLGLSATLFRVQGVQGPKKDGTITLTIQQHDDTWYIDALSQRPDPEYSNPKRDKLARASFPLCPDLVAPRSGDAWRSTSERTFKVTPKWSVSPTGSWNGQIEVQTKIPANNFGLAQPPQVAIQATTASTGGSLAEGLYYLAISAKDSAGKYSPLSVIAQAYMATGTTEGVVTVPVQWWDSATSGYSLYAGRTPFRLSWQADGSGTPSTVSLSAFLGLRGGAPDQELDAVVAVGKEVAHSGILGAQVQAVGTNSITIGGTGWMANVLAGREISVVAKADYTALPVLNYAITANTTAGVCTVTPDPMLDGLSLGDVIVVRSKPTVSNGGKTLTDALWANPFYPAGMDPTKEVGRLARIIHGTGEGLTNQITSATATSHTFAEAWAVTPDSTSRIIIEEPAWLPLASPLRPISNYSPETVKTFSIPNENYANRMLLIGLRTEDGSENANVEVLTPVREIWITGKPETIRTVTGNYTVVPEDQTLLCDTSAGSFTITLLSSTAVTGRDLYGWKTTSDANTVTIKNVSGVTLVVLSQLKDGFHLKSNG